MDSDVKLALVGFACMLVIAFTIGVLHILGKV
jgi:hypothetical protein